MNNQIIEGLVDLGIFSSKSLSKEEYEKLSNEVQDSSFIYLKGTSSDAWTDNPEWFQQINTKNLSNDEINLLLKISQAKNIKTIKNISLFFLIITIISLVVTFFAFIA